MLITSHKKIGKIKSAGFTLVETLVAISILSLSILGTFTAVQNSLQQSTFAKDQITAFYLTQEAMEYVRNVRDTNGLASISSVLGGGSPVNWLHRLSENAGDPCYFGKTCMIDSPQDTITECAGGAGSCPVINEDSVTGLFGYNGSWPTTHFKRELSFQKISAGDTEVAVTVTISWTSGSFSKTFQVQQLLFNQQ